MKVLCVTNMYPIESRPQFGIFIQEQVVWLRKKGIEVDVLFIRGIDGWFNYIKAIGEIRQRLAETRYDLMHAFYGLSGAVCRWASSDLPLVITFCGSDVYKWWQRPISRWATQRAEAIIVRSAEMKKLLGRDQAEIIPSGVDLEIFHTISKEEARRNLGWEMEKTYVIFLADPNRKEKRVALARDVIEWIKNQAKPFDIELIPVFNESYNRVPFYLSAADVLLLTSYWEGSPNAVKEALACGCPVVSVNVGDVAYWLKDIKGCFICNPVVLELSTALTEVLRNQKRIDYQSRLKELDISVITDRIIEIYQKVTQNKTTDKY